VVDTTITTNTTAMGVKRRQQKEGMMDTNTNTSVLRRMVVE
jgi:hypothetical protein